MDVEIRRLTPDLMEDYLYFFEHAAHEDNPQEDRCYCVCWCSADHRRKSNFYFSTPKKRRKLAVRYIENGMLQGYLAYREGRVVGWCNVNDKSACRYCTSWLRFMSTVPPAAPGARVKSVFCFTIAPEMRQKGIAKLLLQRACEDAAREGYEVMEAYPNKQFVNVFQDFMGPRELYQKCGFHVQDELEQIYVMQKPLNKPDGTAAD